MKKTPLIFVILSIFFSCKSESERRIVGKWEASELRECDDVVPIQIALVNMEFKDNGEYVFNSTLNIHEEGKFRLRKNFLYTTNNLKDKPSEKVVLIQTFTTDTLILQMNFKGKDQFLTLVREGTADRLAKAEVERMEKEAEKLDKQGVDTTKEMEVTKADTTKKSASK
ncbi:MAG: hypothetical protein U5L45_22190 [Saprospiraceae bacterium]|nr:hypothetical protein [Saprospiraceae bacterium]